MSQAQICQLGPAREAGKVGILQRGEDICSLKSADIQLTKQRPSSSSKVHDAASAQIAVAQVKSLQIGPRCLNQPRGYWQGEAQYGRKACGDLQVLHVPPTACKAASLRYAVLAVDLYGQEDAATCTKTPSLNVPLTAKPFRRGHDPDESFCIALDSK